MIEDHPFTPPNTLNFEDAGDPEVCSRCQEPRVKHVPTLGEIHGILKGLRDRGVTYESVKWVMDNQTWYDRTT